MLTRNPPAVLMLSKSKTEKGTALESETQLRLVRREVCFAAAGMFMLLWNSGVVLIYDCCCVGVVDVSCGLVGEREHGAPFRRTHGQRIGRALRSAIYSGVAPLAGAAAAAAASSAASFAARFDACERSSAFSLSASEPVCSYAFHAFFALRFRRCARRAAAFESPFERMCVELWCLCG